MCGDGIAERVQCEQGGHQRVPLLASFSLRHIPDISTVPARTPPAGRGWAAVEQADNGQEFAEFRQEYGRGCATLGGETRSAVR